ncbi:DNA-binding transcriptional MerR regulator [Deinococcus metalli]|uniref:DNA-binding transcriptional MerR regulator n=1 Tax=Deinococcus metalli TaxID=1141878 RepID=A0A7W8NM46_9DEIO|nr:MerR family transcriptional regulator [Deinococcus metalli]MBB5375394.1 DNA-binding transcriptional MerR regulator [Deinococcus metalli]GHF29617.1 HTH-type transcriptional repressor CarH [Deinococcus metalli]
MHLPEQLSHLGMYTASEVESRTGVPATTLRQWERRYGFPRPARNSSGYRLYSPEDVVEIGRMQAHLMQGVSARRAAELTLAGLDPARAPSGAGPNVERLAATLTAALLASDSGKAQAVLGEAYAQLPQETVLLEIVTPTLADIGQRWERGEITVAHEHEATAFLRARLMALMDAADTPAAPGPLVVAACAPGERHELGLMMLTVALRRRGVRVAYLGADVPLGDLAVYARERGAAGVMLALQGDWALPGTRAQRRDLDDLGVPVYLGGALMNSWPELAGELRGIYAGPDFHGAAEQIAQHLRGEDS